MKRKDAINKLARIKLETFSNDERADQLETMRMENWENDSEWKKLPSSIRKEFNSEKLNENPNSKRYDEVLLLWIRDALKPVTNEYLINNLGCKNIEGEPINFESCPCCGRRTIEIRGDFDICKICWWEDDGQDNNSADEVFGGPNYEISLTQGRYNFLSDGIYDPNRTDLKSIQEDKDKYVLGRNFQISDDGFVIEIGTDWKGKIKTFD